LGLSICRTILERLQGRIWAETVATGGARLRLALPATYAEHGRWIDQRISSPQRAASEHLRAARHAAGS
jgi:hypothetical protein